jgi:hypothetical protein
MKYGTKREPGQTVLGYSLQDLQLHLEKQFESGMTWDNYGRGKGKWTIDHIYPTSGFVLGTPPAIVSALSNIRPMWYTDNQLKGKKILS